MAKKSNLTIVLEDIERILDDARDKMDIANNPQLVSFHRGRIAAMTEIREKVSKLKDSTVKNTKTDENQ